MNCPNCGNRSCNCTWKEQGRAFAILRKREAERRKELHRPTVVEQEEYARKHGYVTPDMIR